MKKILLVGIITLLLSSCSAGNNNSTPIGYHPNLDGTITDTNFTLNEKQLFLYKDHNENRVCDEWYSELLMITDTEGYIRYNQCQSGEWYVIKSKENMYISVYEYFKTYQTITYEDLVDLKIIYPYSTNSYNYELNINLNNLSLLSAKVFTYDGEINTNHSVNFTILDLDATIDDIMLPVQKTFNHSIEDHSISYSSLGFITYGTALKAKFEVTDGEHIFFVKLVTDGTIIIEQNIKEDGSFFGYRLNDSNISNELEAIIIDLYNEQ